MVVDIGDPDDAALITNGEIEIGELLIDTLQHLSMPIHAHQVPSWNLLKLKQMRAGTRQVILPSPVWRC